MADNARREVEILVPLSHLHLMGILTALNMEEAILGLNDSQVEARTRIEHAFREAMRGMA